MPAILAAAVSGHAPNLWMALPFALLLSLIAIGPLAFHAFWERSYPYFSAGLGSISAAYYLFILHDPTAIRRVTEEYISFMTLIGGLFVISGGIHLTVKGEATPLRNCIFLLAGAIAANLIGTTGASMLLIRPFVRMNKYRVTAHHVVFFIFIVSNVGGCLTPIGDPPLFLGYLKGVPFWWVFCRCWEAWLITIGGLLAVFFYVDRRNFLRAPREVREEKTASEEWRFDGLPNLAFLGIALGGVFLPLWWREAVIAVAAAASWAATPARVHEANRFNFAPVSEVAWLFAGLFATMLPALQWLEMNASTLGLRDPHHFYWVTGALSGFLDNAPTYLAFLVTAFGVTGLDLDQPRAMAQFIANHDRYLLAISLSSVFFGAMTYLGNGPNFMVKSIAREMKVETPGFAGYIVRYALPMLLPLLLLVSILFFSRWRVF